MGEEGGWMMMMVFFLNENDDSSSSSSSSSSSGTHCYYKRLGSNKKAPKRAPIPTNSNSSFFSSSSSSLASASILVFFLTVGLCVGICAWLSLVFVGSFGGKHTNPCGGARKQALARGLRGSPWPSPWGPHWNFETMDLSDSSDVTLAEIQPRSIANSSKDLSMRHLAFGIAGCANLWPRRKEYVKLWWRPLEMRGFAWLEALAESKPENNSNNNDSETLPPIRISEDISKFRYTNPAGQPSGIRIARIVKETVSLKLPDVRWIVLGDDDTVFSVDNLLNVLKKYDHREFYYIGNPSESHSSNTYFSHGMAFGGGGIAISYPLAEALAQTLDECMEKYPFLFGSDDRLHACISELGVPLTRELGFHQMDIHGDAFGFLAAHPIAPFISVHHLDEIEPIFPDLGVKEGLHLFTEAMRMEPSSFLQHCVCYNKDQQLSFAISLGYVVQVYPYILLPREVGRPEITFKAWNKKDKGGEFDMDTRKATRSICNKPFRFYFEKMRVEEHGVVVSTYKQDGSVLEKKRRSFCFFRSSPIKDVERIQVESKPMTSHWFLVPRRQCSRVTSTNRTVIAMSVGSCLPGLTSIS